MNSTEDQIIAKGYYSIIIVGIIIVVATIGTSNQASVIGTQIGYSFILVGLTIMTGVLMGKLGYNGNNSVLSYLMTCGPFFFLIIVVGYLIYLIYTNMNIISDGNVSKGYYNFSKIIAALIFAQLLLFYYGTQNKAYQQTQSLPKVYGLAIYLLGLITLLCNFTLETILTKFTTDG